MIVRAIAPGDYSQVRELLVAAFPRADEAALVERLRDAGDAAIELVAADEGHVIGHILFSPVEAPFRALALAPLAVLPDRQGSGVGAALIRAGHQEARRQGWAASFVLGEPAYYRRFGYDAEAARGFDSPYAGEYFMVLALDGALPLRSGEVRHAPAFAALG